MRYDFMLLVAEAEVRRPNDLPEQATRVIGDRATIRAPLTRLTGGRPAARLAQRRRLLRLAYRLVRVLCLDRAEQDILGPPIAPQHFSVYYYNTANDAKKTNRIPQN